MQIVFGPDDMGIFVRVQFLAESHVVQDASRLASDGIVCQVPAPRDDMRHAECHLQLLVGFAECLFSLVTCGDVHTEDVDLVFLPGMAENDLIEFFTLLEVIEE